MIKKDFFKEDTLKVARKLLGQKIKIGPCSGIIVETEAYKDDPASHARKKTKRSQIMYESHGRVYVYLIYGMYYCLNFTSHKNHPGAVLIRAIEPKEGIPLMKKRRKTDQLKNLCSGPGKLCQALNINTSHNNQPINKQIKLYPSKKKPQIKSDSRIGINQGQELKWRFYIKNNPFVSKI